MFERLEQIEARYEELTQALASPEITNDSAKYQKTAKAHSEISSIVEKYREYKDLQRGIVESRAMLVDETDAEMRAYLAGGEWAGKAGAYGVQGRAGAFVIALNGSYTGVVGLPLYETRALLTGLGWPGP